MGNAASSHAAHARNDDRRARETPDMRGTREKSAFFHILLFTAASSIPYHELAKCGFQPAKTYIREISDKGALWQQQK
jgi:hypothetical protein